MRKTVALDIGGVSIQLRYQEAYANFGVSSPAELPAEFTALCGEYECGRISTEVWLKGFREITKFRYSENELLSIWCSVIGDTVPGMKEQIEKYAANGYDFIFLSDISETHLAETFRKCSFAHAVIGGIYSFEVGARKPDHAMFRAFENAYGRPAFYFDDRADNIESAKKFGWNAIRFHSADQLDALGV